MSSSVTASTSGLVRPDAGWQFTLVPAAGEGGGSLSSVRRVPDYVARGSAADPERAATEAGRRARSTLRRYCAANGLNRLGTLTYRGQGNHGPVLLREHLAAFFRELRNGLEGRPFAYAWVPEWHKSGHGLHAHFAVGRYIQRSVIQKAWPHGFVHIKLIGDLPVGAGRLSESRVAGGYLAKYVAKTFGEDRDPRLGRHRYDVAEGFQPKKIHLTGSSVGEVLAQASEVLHAAPETLWASSTVDDWRGPPTVWAQWGR